MGRVLSPLHPPQKQQPPRSPSAFFDLSDRGYTSSGTPAGGAAGDASALALLERSAESLLHLDARSPSADAAPSGSSPSTGRGSDWGGQMLSWPAESSSSLFTTLIDAPAPPPPPPPRHSPHSSDPAPVAALRRQAPPGRARGRSAPPPRGAGAAAPPPSVAACSPPARTSATGGLSWPAAPAVPQALPAGWDALRRAAEAAADAALSGPPPVTCSKEQPATDALRSILSAAAAAERAASRSPSPPYSAAGSRRSVASSGGSAGRQPRFRLTATYAERYGGGGGAPHRAALLAAADPAAAAPLPTLALPSAATAAQQAPQNAAVAWRDRVRRCAKAWGSAKLASAAAAGANSGTLPLPSAATAAGGHRRRAAPAPQPAATLPASPPRGAAAARQRARLGHLKMMERVERVLRGSDSGSATTSPESGAPVTRWRERRAEYDGALLRLWDERRRREEEERYRPSVTIRSASAPEPRRGLPPLSPPQKEGATRDVAPYIGAAAGSGRRAAGTGVFAAPPARAALLHHLQEVESLDPVSMLALKRALAPGPPPTAVPRNAARSISLYSGGGGGPRQRMAVPEEERARRERVAADEARFRGKLWQSHTAAEGRIHVGYRPNGRSGTGNWAAGLRRNPPSAAAAAAAAWRPAFSPAAAASVGPKWSPLDSPTARCRALLASAVHLPRADAYGAVRRSHRRVGLNTKHTLPLPFRRCFFLSGSPFLRTTRDDAPPLVDS